MKSSVFASALFASLALAAPLNKRAYATKTHVVMETVVVYTTVWSNAPATEAPAAASSPALFFEKPSAAPAVPSSSSAPAPAPVPEDPSSSSTPAPVVPSSTPAPAPVSSEAPSSSAVPVVETPTPSPKPAPTPEVTPEAAPSSTAPAVEATPASTPSTGGSSGGQEFTGSLTMNYFNGGNGACGFPVEDNTMVAALSITGFGASTYNTMTGEATNKWCNQKIRVTYNGKSADATIVDRCEGCTGEGGLDATPALWQALTGGIGGASGDRLETGMSFTLLT